MVVFESTGNLATENPRNTDGSHEIFLFDYAQHCIFQITDTISLRADPAVRFTQANIRVQIVNVRLVISNDGRWIAFGSNATTATPTAPIDTTNPGNFNAQSFNPIAPATLFFETRNNISHVGAIAAGNESDLNPNASRPTQIYAYPLDVPAATATTLIENLGNQSAFSVFHSPFPNFLVLYYSDNNDNNLYK